MLWLPAEFCPPRIAADKLDGQREGNLDDQIKQNEELPVAPDADQARMLIYEQIVKRVRDDSGQNARLTSTTAISSLIPDPGKIHAFLVGLIGNSNYRDIRLMVAANDASYLYSETYLLREAAEKLLFGEEVRGQIAGRVREDSSKKKRLTPVSALGMIPGAEPDKINDHLMLFRNDERYQDLRVVADTRGTRYLYSEAGITGTYAAVLARAEANDPVATIAATVRDESRIYPRPTSLRTFQAPIFNINPTELEKYAVEVMQRPENKDIKSLLASTGTLYLYSETYLNPDWVRATVEWEEVGRYLNP
jgi:hypothetical protein